MTLLPEVLTELHELVSAACDERLDSAGRGRLETLLQGDSEARRFYLRYYHLHFALLPPGNVSLAGITASQTDRPPESVHQPAPAAPELPPLPIVDLMPGQDHLGFRVFMWSVMSLLGGILGTLMVMVGLMIWGPRPAEKPIAETPPAATSPLVSEGVNPKPQIANLKTQVSTPKSEDRPNSTPVARLAETDEPQWSGNVPRADEKLGVGRRLRLDNGLARLAFNTGASVLLEGPAQVEIVSANGLYAWEGKLTVRAATEKSRGFTVESKNLTVVDLGTEFGMAVSPSGFREVHVFEGRVEARPGPDIQIADDLKAPALHAGAQGSGLSPGESRREGGMPSGIVLEANHALQIDPRIETARAASVEPHRFVHAMPPPKPVPFPLFSTGVGLDRGTADPHWQIVAVSTEPRFKPQAAMVVRSEGGYPPGSRDTAQWLSRTTSPGIHPAGCRWTFRTEFELRGLDPASARIEGHCFVDDFLVELRLNGMPLPLPAGCRSDDALWKGLPLRVDSGFVAGRNVLEVVIENRTDPKGESDALSAMALKIELHGTAHAITVEHEP